MLYRADVRNERGIALVVVLLVVLAVAAIAGGAAFLGSNTTLINKYHHRLSVLETAADAGLEEARSAINGSPKTLYPDTGYKTLENGVAVYAADGSVIPNVQRWTYVGPTGITSGQYGVFGSVVVVAQDAQGNRVVRRGEVYQESFAKYAYFTNIEGSIVFAAADQLFGPVFSNDMIRIGSGSPGATFWGPIATAKTIFNKSNGNYKAGYTENAPPIAFPDVADLAKLKGQALAGGTAITSTTAGTVGQATTRIEFVALDLDADNDSTDSDEGFMKVYQVASSANAWWVVADTFQYHSGGATGLSKSRNCGHTVAASSDHGTAFRTFRHHKTSGVTDVQTWAIMQGTRRCFLGGSDILNDWTLPTPGSFLATDSLGSWVPWAGFVDPRVSAVRPADAAYLWPLSRALNPNFKGVVHVEGKVALGGKLRGQITLAATNDIIIADDITYVTNPGGTSPCNASGRDILGLFSGTDVVVADNLINDAISPNNSSTLLTWDPDGGDEYIHAVVLALSKFTVESYNTGPTNFEKCSTTNWGRGCLYLTGGIIQWQRGAVGLVDGHGNLKRYQYDNCAASNPPPYFPTTGHFVRGHYYEVEPTGFNIATFWPLLVPN